MAEMPLSLAGPIQSPPSCRFAASLGGETRMGRGDERRLIGVGCVVSLSAFSSAPFSGLEAGGPSSSVPMRCVTDAVGGMQPELQC